MPTFCPKITSKLERADFTPIGANAGTLNASFFGVKTHGAQRWCRGRQLPSLLRKEKLKPPFRCELPAGGAMLVPVSWL